MVRCLLLKRLRQLCNYKPSLTSVLMTCLLCSGPGGDLAGPDLQVRCAGQRRRRRSVPGLETGRRPGHAGQAAAPGTAALPLDLPEWPHHQSAGSEASVLAKDCVNLYVFVYGY